MESLQDEIREIRKQLRLAMNGVISTSMREKGIVYKLNFGVPYPEIKEIARKHKPNGELAAALPAGAAPLGADVQRRAELSSAHHPGQSGAGHGARGASPGRGGKGRPGHVRRRVGVRARGGRLDGKAGLSPEGSPKILLCGVRRQRRRPRRPRRQYGTLLHAGPISLNNIDKNISI